MKSTLLFCLATTFAGYASAGEIKLEDCPDAVRETVGQHQRQGRVDEVESYNIQGRALYVVEIELPTRRELKLHISPDGTLVKMSEEVSLAELPDVVRAVVEEKAAGGTLDDLEKETMGKVVNYRMEIEREKMPDVDLLLDAAGGILSEKEEADD